jgi:DNA polymerase III, alpha subunit (gram-positive type)
MIMNSEFCFTPQMQQYILGLPLPHQDVVRFYTGFLSPKSMSADEIAKKITEEYHYPLSYAHVEEILSEAEMMLQNPVKDIPYDCCKLKVTGTVTQKGIDKLAQSINDGYKILVQISNYLDKKGTMTEAIFVVKSDEGFKNLKEIIDAGKNDLFNRVAYSFAMEHRDGLLMGDSFNWSEADKLVEISADREELRRVLSEKYQDADFVQFPRISSLYISAKSDMAKYKTGGPISMRERLQKRKMTARLCAEMFDEMGKPVIRGFNTAGIGTMDLYEYYYLGESLCNKAVLETPNKISQGIPSLRPDGQEIQTIMIDEKELLNMLRS